MHLGMPELLLILAIALLLFGPKKLGELGKGLGEGIRGFKSGLGGPPEPAKPADTTPPTAAAEPKSASAPSLPAAETKPADGTAPSVEIKAQVEEKK